MAGSWLIASVYIDWMMHTSSTMSPVCGSSSLSHAPHLPCCANLKIEPASGIDDCCTDMPVSRWPPRTRSGSCSPFFSLSSGL